MRQGPGADGAGRTQRTGASVRRAAAFLVSAVLLLVAPAAAAFKYVEVGDKAPAFSLRDLQGQEVALETRVGSRALAIVFWATWSPRSRTLLDDMEAFYRERKAQGLEVLAVNVDHEHLSAEDRRAVEEMAAAWSFPVLVDDGLATYDAYGVVATPSVAVLDEGGEIRYARASYSTGTREDLREAVDALLGIADDAKLLSVAKKRDYVPPKRATLHYQKAEVLVGRGMARRAVRDLEEAGKLEPQWADPRVLLARVYLTEERGDRSSLVKAEGLLQEAVELQPRHLRAHALLAEVRGALGKFDEALRAAEETLTLEPGYTPAILVRAKSLRALGRLEEAQQVLEEAMEADPRNPAVFAERGEILAAHGRWREAGDFLRRAVELALGARSGEG